MAENNKMFVPPAVVKKNTADQPSMGAPHGGGTQYYQMPSNNEFEVLGHIKGHQQVQNIDPVPNIKRFIG
jgi:hypothetical protein